MTKTKLPVKARPSGELYGRPAYSDAVKRKLLSGLRTGMRRNAAAAFAGIHRDTIYDWIATSKEFAAEVEKAEDYAEARYTSKISDATLALSEGVRLRAAEFWLERRRPEGWRDKSSIEVSLPPEVTEARSRQIDDLTAELRALGEELVRRGTSRSR